jgi:hypothetical protein
MTGILAPEERMRQGMDLKPALFDVKETSSIQKSPEQTILS